MEALEEVIEFAARSKERNSLPKRKRTKRQRGQSPFAFSIGGTPSEEKVGKVGPLSPANSSEVSRGGDETNEEEDMAHCLILLARGQLSGGHERRQLSGEEDDEANDDRRHDRFNSKRFLETGEYVFQCRTCDKVFPSFQALGGHRASHKKPKITTTPAMADDKKRQILSTSSPDDATDDEDSLSLQLMSTRNSCPRPSNNNNGKQTTKVHECSICGAEFSSGQALGGHMRRHRPLMTGQTQPALALTPKTPESEEPSRPRNNIKVPSLQLDLNLPAPEDDDPAEAGSFPLNSRGEERRDRSNQLVLSFPALVGCHY